MTRRPSEALLLPMENEVQVRRIECEPTWLRVLRTVTYVAVIITCVVLLFTLIEVNIMINQVQEAARRWLDDITAPGMLN